MSFHESNVNNSRSKFDVEGLQEGSEIRVMVPRPESDVDPRIVSDKLQSGKYMLHEFPVQDNSCALIIEIKTEYPVDVELFVKKGGEPNPSKGVYDFNVTIPAELVSLRGANSSNFTSPSYSHRQFLSNDALNWSAAGTYFAKVRYKKSNRSMADEEPSEIPYNFSVSSHICLYYDKKKKDWATDGVKVTNVNCSS